MLSSRSDCQQCLAMPAPRIGGGLRNMLHIGFRRSSRVGTKRVSDLSHPAGRGIFKRFSGISNVLLNFEFLPRQTKLGINASHGHLVFYVSSCQTPQFQKKLFSFLVCHPRHEHKAPLPLPWEPAETPANPSACATARIPTSRVPPGPSGMGPCPRHP